MARQLEHEGVFKATPASWGLQDSQNTQSVALVVTFRILEKFENGAWEDWTKFEDQEITGWFYIVKKDGGLNAATVENLVKSIGWDGNLDLSAAPQDTVCQITAANEEYNGKVRLKVQWLNPGDFVPGPKTVDAQTAKNLQARYGSQLRAAAAAAKPRQATTAKATPPPPARQAPPPQTDANDPGVSEDDLPFDHRAAAVTGDMPAALGAGDKSGARVGAPAPQFTVDPMAAIDRGINAAVAVMEEDGPLGYLGSLGFVELNLETMTFSELRDHANLMFKDMDAGERQFIRSCIAQDNRDKLAAALRIVLKRMGGK